MLADGEGYAQKPPHLSNGISHHGDLIVNIIPFQEDIQNLSRINAQIQANLDVKIKG